jgi:putative sterol carrier protein
MNPPTWIVCLTSTIALGVFGSNFVTAAERKPSITPQQVFDGMRQDFRSDKARGLRARYQWELSGPDGGEWWIEINDGKYKMGRGRIADPNVTFITSDKDWVALSTGKLTGTWAYLTGRLKVRGPHAIARKLDDIFP